MRVVALLAIVAGVAVRVWVWRQPFMLLHYDGATVGLEARYFLRGELSPFFWGQSYGGTAETGVVALAFSLFGSSWLVLSLVPTALHGVASVLTWRAGLRLLDRPRAIAAGLVLWTFPPPFVWLSMRTYGFYAVSEVLAVAVMLVVLRLHQRVRTLDLAVLGLLCGLALWTTPLLAVAVVPPVGWLVWRSDVARAGWRAALAGVVVGAVPWWAWNVGHGWRSIDLSSGLHRTVLGRLDALRDQASFLFGLRAPFTHDYLFPGPPLVTTAVVVMVLVLGVHRTPRPTSRGFFVIALVGGVLLYAINSRAGLSGQDPRYLVVYAPLAALLTASAVGPARPWRVLMAGAALVSLTVWGFSHFGVEGPTGQTGQYRPGNPLAQAISDLRGHGDRFVYTERDGYTVTFVTDERVVAGSFANQRHTSFDCKLRRAPNFAYLLDASLSLHNDVALVQYLNAHGITFTAKSFGPWRLIRPAVRVLPEQVPLLEFFLGPYAPFKALAACSRAQR